ncbi:MAG: BrnA antitoxin family protein [Prochloraceae cyanobacterium]
MSGKDFSPNLCDEERHKRLLRMKDSEIDYSDIPPLDDNFFKKAKLVKQTPRTQLISIRIDLNVLEDLKRIAQEKDEGYQTLIKDILRTFVAAHPIKLPPANEVKDDS